MRRINAESTLSLLFAIGLFALITLGIIHWQAQQQRQTRLLFQQQQALQIAENQLERQLAELNCERQIQQNDLVFQIERCTLNEVHIRFPIGELTLRPSSF